MSAGFTGSAPMPTDLIAFVDAMDRCWIERRYAALADYLSAEVVIATPDGRARTEGAAAAIESYREFMERCSVRRFDTSGHRITASPSAAVVEYDWWMDWTDGAASHEARGREILVIDTGASPRVLWRMQLPAA